MAHRVTLVPGDGIGPEVTEAARLVADASGVKIDWEIVQAGEKAIERTGSPLPEEVLDSIRRNRLAVKGPITTPIGGGFRSVNVALRQQLDLYASVRPARAIAGEGTRYPDTDLIVVREATEGLYSGVEHWVDRDHTAAETVNIITRKASDRIIRFAFELARREHRHRVTAVHKSQGLVLGMTVRENVTLAHVGEFVGRDLLVNRAKETQATNQFIAELRIRTPSPEQLVRNLSGGNQQKVVLAKWLLGHARVLLFDEPTRGIDVGSKAEIYNLMVSLARNGAGIVMVSSDLPEILGMSHRICVVRGGAIVREFLRGEATPDAVIAVATGAA